MNTDTQALQAWQEHRAKLDEEHNRFRNLINRITLAEFPVGTRVFWKQPGFRTFTKGEVTGHIEGETASVTVKSIQGSGHTVHAWELFRLDTTQETVE